ncbi:MAG: hypothetical protein AB7H81_03950 [Vicinamibacterales bacterium]
MSSRYASLITATALAGLVIVRAFPFVWWSGTHFDSDQAIVGLMAKHISEARAFPLYYYGQNYMLAVEAWLAAPVMALTSPSVTALKLPLVAINVAVVLLLLRLLVREAGLAAGIAAIAALPLALPAAGMAARTTEANGGNVEPFLYVLLLWMARARPCLFGIVLGVGVLHREFTAYGAAALLVMDCLGLMGGSGEGRAAWRARLLDKSSRWAVAGVAFLCVRGVAAAVRPFANGLGPGTRGDDPALVATVVDTLGGRICVDPATWPERASLLVFDHLPRLVGGTPAPLADYGVLTGVYSGLPGLGPWVAAITAVGVLAGAWHWLTVARGQPDSVLPIPGGAPATPVARTLAPDTGERPADTRRSPPVTSHLGSYLILVGLISTLVYGFLTCSSIRVETMRYNLLGLFIPVGALVMALQAWRAPAARAGLGAAVVLWCALNTSDVMALTRERATRPPVDRRQALADLLEARGVTVAWARFRNSYHVTFLSAERVRVSANDFIRVQAYADEARRAGAPTLSEEPCEAGEALLPGLFLCR